MVLDAVGGFPVDEAQRLSPHPSAAATAALALTAGALAVGLGALIGNPSPGGFLLIAVAAAAVMAGFILKRPFMGFLILVPSTTLLAVVAVTENRYLNTFDLVVPTLLLLAILRRADREVRARDALLVGPAHEVIHRASRRFARAVAAYLLLTGLSLVPMLVRIGTEQALTSAFVRARTRE